MHEQHPEYTMFLYELSRLAMDHESCEVDEIRLQIAEDIDLLERALYALQ
ncbi:hypothetical protein [Edaphobacillus lindanitolerans]|uniref:Uncharacterized protein n=1 Tax=Edaphobacillus lindanitolerans TaxID=550447 RepID=A0A1U7PK98_9BACI|nr:hypothetical protein [Edaphobacillus lindanitolerans]SIT72538.1 hypothetical protein SAMN05428946_0874 [Edaphobacillus lindanitolerans]